MMRHDKNAGFTIVELMIALTILAVILLISTIVLLQIGKLYSKGVNSANTQNAARAVISDISGDIQFSGKSPFSCTELATTCAASVIYRTANGKDFAIYAYCIGTTRYSYIMNSELSDAPNTGQTYHVLWRDTMGNDSSCQPLDITQQIPAVTGTATPPAAGTYGKELMPERTRLTRLYILPLGGNDPVYGIDVWVAYGDDDLLNIKGASGGSCQVGIGSSDCAGYATCRGGLGQEFCANSMLSTTISRRLE